MLYFLYYTRYARMCYSQSMKKQQDIYDDNFEEALRELADEYSLTRIRVETKAARQEYARTEGNPVLHRVHNQVVVRKGGRYAVAEVPHGGDPYEVYDATETVMRNKLAEYNRQYRTEHRDKVRAINRVSQRRRRAEERERRDELNRRGN